MLGCVWRAGSVAIAVALYILPAGAVDTSRTVQFVQNVSDPGRATAEPSQPPVADVPPVLPANSREQIRKAQIELRRLDCLQGRTDGKLGEVDCGPCRTRRQFLPAAAAILWLRRPPKHEFRGAAFRPPAGSGPRHVRAASLSGLDASERVPLTFIQRHCRA